MEKAKKWNSIAITVLLISLMLFMNVGAIFIINGSLDYLSFSKNLSFYLVGCLIFYSIHKAISKEGIKLKDIIIILMSIFAFISYSNALDMRVALDGTWGRNEGLKIILTYYSIYLLSSTLPKKNQKKIMSFFLATGIFQIIIGTLQTLNITNILGYSRIDNFSTKFKFASGTFGNPNFYSTYVLMGLLYSFGSIFKSKKVPHVITYIVLSIVFAYGLIIGNTSSCLLAALLVIPIFLLSKINKNNFKKVLFGMTIFAVVAAFSLFIIDKTLDNKISRTMAKNVDEVKEILENGIQDSTGNYRIYVWKKALEIVPQYIHHGVGIDNFGFINNGTYICVNTAEVHECFDKAHNEYIQLLVTQGIYAFITYLVLLGYVAIMYFKNKKQDYQIDSALFIVFLGYLIQATFNISVITVAPIFYMIMGFICYSRESEQKQISLNFKDYDIDLKTIVIIIAIVMLTLFRCLMS